MGLAPLESQCCIAGELVVLSTVQGYTYEDTTTKVYGDI